MGSVFSSNITEENDLISKIDSLYQENFALISKINTLKLNQELNSEYSNKGKGHESNLSFHNINKNVTALGTSIKQINEISFIEAPNYDESLRELEALYHQNQLFFELKSHVSSYNSELKDLNSKTLELKRIYNEMNVKNYGIEELENRKINLENEIESLNKNLKELKIKINQKKGFVLLKNKRKRAGTVVNSPTTQLEIRSKNFMKAEILRKLGSLKIEDKNKINPCENAAKKEDSSCNTPKIEATNVHKKTFSIASQEYLELNSSLD